MSPFNWFAMFLIFIASFILMMCKLFNYNSLLLNVASSNKISFLKGLTNKSWLW